MNRSLFARGITFSILHPGLVAGVIPYVLVSETPLRAESIPVYGAILIMLGSVVLITCIYQFGTQGKGTLSPLDPTKVLVTEGIYRYTRNPMYVSVMTILVGECLMFASRTLIIYAVAVLIGFHQFILFHEEPRLKKVFGQAYIDYAKKVRRWI